MQKNVFVRSLSSMFEHLMYKYNNKVELVNTHMTKRKEWWWCSGNNIYPYVQNKHNYQRKKKKPIYLVEFCGEIKQTNKDFYSESSKTTYYTISWNIEIARQGLNITNLSEIRQTHQWQCCRDVSWISERCDDYNIASCGFERVFVR